ncbi:hypothetical protein AaE_009196 [Aphanomyces astaci]|uniref:DDE-1 domain-containing protein n=1 Tax=Aphanomyces astaci TaxID=112090 RepID=A0A6A5A8H8_APHAT|nr:hypothetical protein AaE_009196 [Aphanomyces astaci]
MLWIKRNRKQWLHSYLVTKISVDHGYRALNHLLRWFSKRHRKQAHFWGKYGHYDKTNILYADETSVSLAEVGKSSKVDKATKHSERISVVCTIRADGVKLLLLFIVKGKPGGTIKKDELPLCDDRHVYAVQANVWLDSRVCAIYLEHLLAQHVDDTSVLLVDNLDYHVSDASHDKTAGAIVSVPLDVGVIGPLKALLMKLEWLFEDNDLESVEMTAQEKRSATINRTIRCWDRISSETVTKAFEKAIPFVIEL